MVAAVLAGATLDAAWHGWRKTAHGVDDPLFIRTLADAVLRARARLSWWLASAKTDASAANLILLFNVMQGQTPPADISDAQRAMLTRLRGRTVDAPVQPEAVRGEVPPAFEPALRRAFGDRFLDETRALILPAPLALRVNTLKATRAQAAAALAHDGVSTREGRLSPVALIADAETDIAATQAFKDGWVEPQDEASQLVALLAGARPGEQVLDLCAGAGGKTLALAAAMENRGHIAACDVHGRRLARARVRLKRAGAENAAVRLLDDAGAKWLAARPGWFHRVMIDAPCTGVGAWRRNPEARWSPRAAEIAAIAALQDRLLDQAAPAVKPGGRLVYATCSPLREENDDRIEAFLARWPAFRTQLASTLWSSISDAPYPSDDSDILRLTPARHGTDGFTVTVLTRLKTPGGAT